MSEGRIVSRADIVFESLEDRIISGEYPPGTVLCEQKISEALGVSRTPVREALNRLKQAELITDTGKGLTVVGITRSDLEDIYEIRIRVEGLATARCAQVITPEQLQRLRELVEMEEFYAAKAQTGTEVRDLDSEFHNDIYTFCGSHVFHRTLQNLHKKIQKYRKLSIHNPGRAVTAAAEHRTIYEALLKHDAPAAEAAAIAHIISARTHVLEAKNEEEI